MFGTVNEMWYSLKYLWFSSRIKGCTGIPKSIIKVMVMCKLNLQ